MEMRTMPDAAFAVLTDEITAAREALVALVREDPERSWHPYELKMQVRNGWSAGAVSLALDYLIEDGTFEVQETRIRFRR
jgi:hypothetical protein